MAKAKTAEVVETVKEAVVVEEKVAKKERKFLCREKDRLRNERHLPARSRCALLKQVSKFDCGHTPSAQDDKRGLLPTAACRPVRVILSEAGGEVELLRSKSAQRNLGRRCWSAGTVLRQQREQSIYYIRCDIVVISGLGILLMV